jgi:hypothetical protein
MAKKDVISKMKKMMPKEGEGKGKMLELSVETPEEEAYEHAPGGPEEGKEEEEINIPLDGMEEEEGMGEEAGESGEASPDLASFSDEDLLSELMRRKEEAKPAPKPGTPGPKGGY